MILDAQSGRDAPSPAPAPRYHIGQLVRHRRYGYRGVVVDLDLSCRADEAWYQSNKTQPRRDQAWYHVLVDGSSVTTYAAETSLLEDDRAEPVEHPLVAVFFERFTGTQYVRNDKPWML